MAIEHREALERAEGIGQSLQLILSSHDEQAKANAELTRRVAVLEERLRKATEREEQYIKDAEMNLRAHVQDDNILRVELNDYRAQLGAKMEELTSARAKIGELQEQIAEMADHPDVKAARARVIEEQVIELQKEHQRLTTPLAAPKTDAKKKG